MTGRSKLNYFLKSILLLILIFSKTRACVTCRRMKKKCGLTEEESAKGVKPKDGAGRGKGKERERKRKRADDDEEDGEEDEEEFRDWMTRRLMKMDGAIEKLTKVVDQMAETQRTELAEVTRRQKVMGKEVAGLKGGVQMLNNEVKTGTIGMRVGLAEVKEELKNLAEEVKNSYISDKEENGERKEKGKSPELKVPESRMGTDEEEGEDEDEKMELTEE